MIKTEEDIKSIKQAASIWKLARVALIEATKPGISLLELDTIAKNVIESHGATCAFYDYGGFPGHICISVNEVIIHGVPNEYILKDGDSVTFDVGVKYADHFCDAAFTVFVGEVSPQARNISNVCYESLMRAIAIIKPGVSNKDLAAVIQDYVEHMGYEVIRNFSGHGCGNKLHEDPAISNYRSSDVWFQEVKLEPGMVICIEPMIMTGSNKFIIDPKNNWSVIAKNKKLTSHWEHMVLVTNDGCEVLTN
ncbi:MAG: type I methionyl aminopeptidase [Mycoplasma sp.]